MNQYNETIQELINLKVISLDQVLEFAYNHYMNEQLDQMMAEQETDCDLDHYDPHPEYVVASTNHEKGETLVFPSDENGVISYYMEVASEYDLNHITRLSQLNTDEHSYHFVKRLNSSNGFYQSLFKKVKNG